jgi:twitching motility protein PilI
MDKWKNRRLRDFQTQLLERMSAARSGMETHEGRLGMIVNGRHCLVDLREAEEIIHLLPITTVPLTRDWYLGLANVRGNLISVVDLDRFCGAPSSVPGKHSRVIVLRSGQAGLCGLLVASVLGLRYPQKMALQESAADIPPWPCGRHYLDQDLCVWIEIRLSTFVDDARFMEVAL